jgi:hypothetical protein
MPLWKTEKGYPEILVWDIFVSISKVRWKSKVIDAKKALKTPFLDTKLVQIDCAVSLPTFKLIPVIEST